MVFNEITRKRSSVGANRIRPFDLAQRSRAYAIRPYPIYGLIS